MERLTLPALLLAALAVMMFGLWHAGASMSAEGFLLRDHGYYLATAEALLHGGRLYGDVAWVYGPVSIYCLAAVGKIFGVSPEVYLAAHVPVILLNLGLAWLLMIRCLPRKIALLAMVFVVFPAFCRMAFGSPVYFPYEVTGLLLVALTWQPPERRSLRYALATGLALGAMQWVKFGGAFVAGAAFLLLDLGYGWRHGLERGRLVNWIKCHFLTLGAFLLMEVLFALVICAGLPGQIVRETLWPSYHLEIYALSGMSRWPVYETLGIFLGTQLPALATLLTGGFLLLQALRAKQSGGAPSVTSPAGVRPTWQAYPLLFFFVFYLIGFLIYYGHQYLTYQYSAVLSISVGWALYAARPWLRATLLAALLPAALALPYKAFVQSKPVVPASMPNGQTLRLSPEDKRLAVAVFKALDQLGGGAAQSGQKPPVVFWGHVGSGWNFYGGYPGISRHTWYMTGLLRPHEADAIFREISRAMAVVLIDAKPADIRKIVADTQTWQIARWSPFTRDKDAQLADLIAAPIVVEDRCAIFPIKKFVAGRRESANAPPSATRAPP